MLTVDGCGWLWTNNSVRFTVSKLEFYADVLMTPHEGGSIGRIGSKSRRPGVPRYCVVITMVLECTVLVCKQAQAA